MYKKSKAAQTPILLRCYQLGFSVIGSVFPALAARYACYLWLRPVKHKTPDSEQAAYDSAIMQSISLDKHQITTYQWGQKGPCVLLVHGWSGRGTQLGSFVTPLLNAGFRVMSLDLPAHGHSSGKQTNILEVVEALQALASEYGPFDSAITHSFGGPCIVMALQQGLTLRRVVAISPAATAKFLFTRFAEILHLTEKTVACMMKYLNQQFGEDILQRISMTNNVEKLTLPALIIHDKDDADVDWEQGKAVATHWPGAQFISTEGLGHRRILRDETVITQAVEFLQQA